MSADAQFRAFIDRVLRLKEEQDALAADIREVYAEAKGTGYDKTAMGQVVAHLRKIEKVGISAVQEGETVFDLYLSAYQRATGTVVATHTHEAADRQARAKARTSEAMDDNKAFSAELVAAGLISEEAHAENVAISDGVARKYGAGVIDPETGEILTQEQPVEPASQSETADQIREVPTVASAEPVEPSANEYAGTSSDKNPASIPHSSEPISSPVTTKPEAVCSSPVSGANSAMTARTKGDVIRLMRPFCAHADDLGKCGGQGTKHCNDCEQIKRTTSVPA